MRKDKKIYKTIAITIIFILGLGTFAFPIISNIIYERAAKRIIQDFEEVSTKTEDTVVKEKLSLAYAYNYYLSGMPNTSSLGFSYTGEEIKNGLDEYARMLKSNEQIGHIIIPKINIDTPLYVGTSEEVLQKGIGNMEGTSLPVGGNYTHAVLTGHRGLPTAKLFTDLNKLEVGDKFYIKNIGGTIAYKVDQIKIVKPTEFSDLAIIPNRDYITLLTCTPYIINSHRLLVRGDRIDYVEEVMKKEVIENNANNIYNDIFFVILIILVGLLTYVLLKYFNSKRTVKMQAKAELTSKDDNKEKD
jgi:sortase A